MSDEEVPKEFFDPDDPKYWPDLREIICGKPSQEVWEGSKEYLDKLIQMEVLCGLDICDSFKIRRLKGLTEFYEEY